jgi:hypothetical protein
VGLINEKNRGSKISCNCPFKCCDLPEIKSSEPKVILPLVFFSPLFSLCIKIIKVTKQEYEATKLTGAETALMELLDALLQDTRMSEKEKKKKLNKFKEAYPALWR